MSDNTAVNRPWTVLPIVSAPIIPLHLFYKAPLWLWFALVSWVLLTAVAILGLSDEKSREFQKGTLNHSSFAQIYRALVGRSHDRLWAAYCDPVDRGAGLWPKPLRRVVAGWIGNAAASQIDATRGAFALGLLWAVPVWVIVALGWAAWHWGGTLAITLAGQYLTVLEWMARALGTG